jgi:dihydrofolate synthase/folylpolyglutamate synthase
VDVTLSSYQRALDALFARTTGKTRLGLERTRALLAAMGDPHRELRTLHVAGTNGKGSVCATLEALLRGTGHRVGKYTSPHLVDFRERVTVDGRPVDESVITDFVSRWSAEVDRLGASFFEATTAMALHAFVQSRVDIAIIEVGLGGRLDSTNVVYPLAAGVTSISIDHTEYLGTKVEEIADEKAGIFKRGVPSIIGDADPSIRERLAWRAREAGGEPVRLVSDECDPRDIALIPSTGRDGGGAGTRFTITLGGRAETFVTPLVGEHQANNAAVALLMLDAAGDPWRQAAEPDAARQALANVRLPGRFQRFGRYIFDVAHNADGAAVTANTLRHVRPRAPVVTLLCVLGDKDWRGMMSALAPVTTHFVVTRAPSAPASREWDVDSALEFARASGWSVEEQEDFDTALQRAAAAGETVLVTGSFHTVGDAMSRLQVDPLAG